MERCECYKENIWVKRVYALKAEVAGDMDV
jgi:hypothetical protein